MGWVPTRRGVITSSRRALFGRRAARVGLAVCLITSGVAVFAQPASASPVWTVATAPTIPGTPLSNLSGVACSGTSVCFAVGQFTFDFDRHQSMVKRWNGTTWVAGTVLNPVGSTSSGLTGVRCPSPTSCFAVGNYNTLTAVKTLIEHWDGTSWTVMTSANPVGPVIDINLNSIACPSAVSCFAVGSYDNGSSVNTLAEHWDGVSWTIQTSPTGTGATDSQLSGLACPSLTSCFAVGEFNTATAQKTLALSYNGTAWSLVASPNPAGTFAALNGVTCYSATGCIAVGGSSTASADNTLTERWSGTAWAIVASPNGAGTSSVLRSVACASATLCLAAGENVTTAEKTLTEKYNGTTWTVLTTPNPVGATDNSLNAIACVGASFCLTVGGSVFTTGLTTLVESWNGTAWTVVTTPAVASTGYGILNAVVCPSTTLCMAVGQSNTGNQTKTATAKYDGVSWTSVVSPNPAGATISKLLGVACPTITICIAVGTFTNASGDHTLVERWNGTTWSILTSLNVSAAQSNTLAGVACPSATSCYAVGNYVKVGVTKTLAEHFDGTAWTIQVSANPASSDPVILESIACPSLTSCFAVGNYDTVSDERTLVEKLSGTSWVVMASANVTNSGVIDLNSVSCASTTSCFAVGFATVGTTTTTLVERMTGTTWAIMSSPNPAGATDAELNGVSCPTLTACFATGRYDTAAGNVTLVEQWAGTTWAVVSSPNGLNTTSSELNSVKCRTDVTCVAVGDNRVVGNRRLLIEQYA